jgi:hypothetical protein
MLCNVMDNSIDYFSKLLMSPMPPLLLRVAHILFGPLPWIGFLAKLWIAMFGNRRCRINWRVNNLSNFDIRLVVGEELFPMR